MTIDELAETYDSMMESRAKQWEFDAKVAGIDIDLSRKVKPVEKPEDRKPSLAERLRSRVEKQKESSAVSGKRTNFSEGVGYQVIGK